jgi:hypothetical protein
MLTWQRHPAFLIHLQAISDNPGKIEREMLNNGASLFVCCYSDEPFKTAEIIGPHWNEIPGHLPSVAVFLSLMLVIFGCGWVAAQGRYEDTQDECST